MQNTQAFFSVFPFLNRKFRTTSLTTFSDSIKVSSHNYKDTEKKLNFNYKYKFSPLSIESAVSLNLSHYKCKPVSFGYSVSEGKKVFPDFEYPSCQVVTGVEKLKLNLNRQKNFLKLDCNKGENGYIFAGPIEGYNMISYNKIHRYPIHKYGRPLKANKLEFGLGFCTNDTLNITNKEYQKKIEKKSTLHGSMVPVFNETLYFESLKRVEKKPRIIFLLTVDSFSRNHFYRKLPKVVDFLNQSSTLLPNMTVYDFLMHTTYSSKSLTNQGPVFGGVSYRKKSKPIGKDKLGANSMWHFMKSQGYVTFMGMDSCDEDFPKFLGENLNIDYSIRQFYCITQKYTSFDTTKSNEEQRCIGPYMSHYYVLNYTLELIKMYKGTNMWIYLHMNAAHERTGQHAGTLDSDLVSFLTEYFQTVNDVYDTFMFLGADHGMRYGDWYRTIDSYQETKLPSMFVLASKSLLDQYPYSYHCLDENRKRLTSKLDIRETVYYLAGIELNGPYAVNLIKDIASYGRSCKVMNINPLYCACSMLKKLNENDTRFFSMLNIVRREVEEIMNLATYNNPKFKQGRFCDKVVLDHIIEFYFLETDSDHEIYQIEFGSSLYIQLKLQVNIALFGNYTIFEAKKSNFRPFIIYSENGMVWGKVIVIQILNIVRLDKYSGKCQALAKNYGIFEQYCLRENCL